MANTEELKRLADERDRVSRTDEVKPIPRLKLSGSFYWLGLATLTPLAIPFLVLGKELTKPFRKQRY